MRSPNVQVTIDLDRVCASAEAIRKKTGVAVIAVIKADAYGLGAPVVADVLAPIVDEFAYFSVTEAREIRRPGLLMGPPLGDPEEFRALGLRPSVTGRADAEKLAGTPFAIDVDTGMQRLGCPPEQIEAIVAEYDVTEFFTHAVTVEAARRLQALCGQYGKPLHAAATSLLDTPEAYFDAVRPGLALYRGAVRVTTRLQHVRTTSGPVGYTGFEHSPVGILFAGYSNAVQPGPIIVNGRRQRIIEVGMNTSFLTVDPRDKPGDEVVLLGSELDEAVLAQHFGVREHEILCRYCGMGPRHYRVGGAPATPGSPGTT
jgi:alanine racemase